MARHQHLAEPPQGRELRGIEIARHRLRRTIFGIETSSFTSSAARTGGCRPCVGLVGTPGAGWPWGNCATSAGAAGTATRDCTKHEHLIHDASYQRFVESRARKKAASKCVFPMPVCGRLQTIRVDGAPSRIVARIWRGPRKILAAEDKARAANVRAAVEHFVLAHDHGGSGGVAPVAGHLHLVAQAPSARPRSLSGCGPPDSGFRGQIRDCRTSYRNARSGTAALPRLPARSCRNR